MYRAHDLHQQPGVDLPKRRFSNLPSWVESTVQTADLNKLEEWADRILEARSQQDNFGENAATPPTFHKTVPTVPLQATGLVLNLK